MAQDSRIESCPQHCPTMEEFLQDRQIPLLQYHVFASSSTS